MTSFDLLMRRPRAFRATSATIIVFVLVASAGCGQREYQLAPVSGRVTLDDRPLVDAHVTFQPTGHESATPGPGSTGVTDQDGRYELTTVPGDFGAVVGKHRVSITSNGFRELAELASDDALPSKPERVPEKYRGLDSELTFDVPADGTESADLVLTTK